MVGTLPPVDIIIVGAGWAGGILAKELAPTGLKIAILERGGPHDTVPEFTDPAKFDELRYANRHELLQDLSRETLTIRNRRSETALPMRQWGAFLLGEGVGGSGLHWNGHTWRWLPWDHQARSRTIARYGAGILPPDMTLRDWPIGYDELEPYYDKFEQTCGTAGAAGNINGVITPGGNPFEGPRRRNYPNPPLLKSHAGQLFETAAAGLGYHPFPLPASNSPQQYVNPDGVEFGPCHYCGYCERFGCEADAKASPHFVTIPVALRHPNVELRTRSRVLRVDLDSTGRKAVGVTYVDAVGRELRQPAELVILAAYGLANVHLLLLSQIGTPYDPESGEGVVGANYAYQATGGAQLLFDEKTYFNAFMGAGGSGVTIDDLNGDNYDAAAAGFIGGGGIACATTGDRPIGQMLPPGTPGWGSAWKRAVVRGYNHSAAVFNLGSVMPYRQNFLDLDPTYRDAFGRPLLRMTFDFQPNEIRQMNGLADIAGKIGTAMGAQRIDRFTASAPFSYARYQTTHNTGGAVFGDTPATSALNRYLQSWDVPNVFAVGANALPQNAGKNPTGPVGALAYWTAEAIRDRYLAHPGTLL